MDDLRIIELYFERNEQAIKETDVKYGKLCHSIAYNILNNHEDSEECVNDTYVGVWNAIPPTRPNYFMSFVCKIARNLSLKRLEFMKREKRSQAVLVSLEELEAVLPDDNVAPDISDEDIGRLISRFLSSQKEEARNVFIRKYYFFDSIREISERYSFTESKVKNMLFYTRNKLKDYLINIGEDAAGKIIKYAKENSIKAEYEPYRSAIAGKIIEITEDCILVDDSILCKAPADGVTYKVLLNDLRISRYVDYGVVAVGDTVQISYEGGIDEENENTIDSAISASRAVISGGDVLFPE